MAKCFASNSLLTRHVRSGTLLHLNILCGDCSGGGRNDKAADNLDELEVPFLADARKSKKGDKRDEVRVLK